MVPMRGRPGLRGSGGAIRRRASAINLRSSAVSLAFGSLSIRSANSAGFGGALVFAVMTGWVVRATAPPYVIL
jgi:hypothetical protein